MNDETTFYAEPACVFSGHQVGWKVLLNTQRPSYYEIKSVSGSELVVAGDLTSPTMAGAGDWFRIITPYGVDSDNGRLSANPWPTTPRTRTWAGYRYMPPAVGATDLTGLISLGTEQIGGNETGGYHCYNREYDITTGRWTTPDPAKQYSNLFSYVGSRPLAHRDPSGLYTKEIVEANMTEMRRWIKYAQKEGWKNTAEVLSKELAFWEQYTTDLASQEDKLTELFEKACNKYREQTLNDFGGEESSTASACFGDSAKDCCKDIAAKMARGITESMRSKIWHNGQRVFGQAGNDQGGKCLVCGGWADLVRNSAMSHITTDNLTECKLWIPAQWDMFRLTLLGQWYGRDFLGGAVQKHNWSRYCWGGYCVDVDPWEFGTADGSVAGGHGFDEAVGVPVPNTPVSTRTKEWAKEIVE
ncbi:MAG: RHS repeat-associated core domain-containing protein [Planctomycetota bacterium]